MNKKTIRDIDVNSKKVLVRVDFNVPLNKEGKSRMRPAYRRLFPPSTTCFSTRPKWCFVRTSAGRTASLK